MAKGKLSWIIGTWGAPFMAAISMLLWMQNNFVTMDKFRDYQKTIDINFQDLKYSVRRLEDKMDKGRGSLYLPGYPTQNFLTNNMGGISYHGQRR